jgi:hypothetical protein
MKAVARCLLVVALLSIAAPLVPARACPNCKDAVAEQGEETGNAKAGYSYGVILMLAAPFTLLGLGSYFVVRAAKKGILPDL